MDSHDTISLGPHLEQAVPRYASYPTPASFDERVGGAQHDAWLASLPPRPALSVYVHIPFCAKLCWYCASRTQAVREPALMEPYLASLEAEIARTAARLPAGAAIARLVWGGGSPTRLTPAQIARLAATLDAAIGRRAGAEFAVEVDTACDAGTLEALASAGMTRAAVGVQDVRPDVQAAIGRAQSAEAVADGVAAVRALGVEAVSVEQLYGLPRQTAASVAETSCAVVALAPERIALVGYAHVPWLAKRQRMICEDGLPDVRSRLAQLNAASAVFAAAGYRALGIDHFVRPDDPLLQATESLGRDFLGYVPRDTDALIGFGAGAISRLPQGYLQNHGQTRAYCEAVAAGGAATARGMALTLEDRVRARAIDMLMCGFRIDFATLRAEFGDFVALLREGCSVAAARFGGLVAFDEEGLRIVSDGPVLARLVARQLDVRTPVAGQWGLAV